ncbi:MAG: hypothetical protein P4L03_04905 [Terracidiphilus sp.]|nr:hypothetical protein [Terracidiphilus sp.]
MQQSTESASVPSSFASLLATLAAPEPPAPPAWDAELAEDVTTLSYESALRAHARYKPSPAPFYSSFVPEPAANPAAACAHAQPTMPLKCASITIRVTEEECAQLRQRAAEAGMTVSAYLRSCTFEAEALRAQVREAVAALRAATATPAVTAPEPVPAPRHHWNWRALLQRLFPMAHPLQHPARA